MRNLLPCLCAAVCCIVLSSCNRGAAPANVAATVNGRPITFAEVDKNFEVEFAGSPEKPTEDQAAIHKLEILRVLIDNEIMLQRAEKLSLIATDADVDAKLTELRTGLTQEQFQQQLKMSKMSMDDLRLKIKRELSVRKVINKEITSHISITDGEIANFYTATKHNFNYPEPIIHLAQIVVTPAPDPVRNLKNDNATNEDAARTKIQTLEARARQGEDFSLLAQNFSEDQNAPNGGDLGFVPESNLEKASPQLRKLISTLGPGQVSSVIPMPNGFSILKVLAREPAGQRELNDPNVQQRIRETLLNRKDQLLRTAYYESARNEAKVVNHYAATIVNNKGLKK